jgi:NADH:ubiquinone oxidoreductase subunit 4 (subunit M)
LIILRIVIFRNFRVPPTLGFWGEVVFLRIFYRTERFFFFYSVIYLILVCYYSIFLYLSLSQANIRRKIECREETFFMSGLIIVFFFPRLIFFF